MFSTNNLSVICLLHFVAFFHVASLFVREVENRKVGVDNKKALELTNSSVFHRGRQQKGSTVISLYFNFPTLYFPYTLISLHFNFPTLISLDYDFPIHR